MDDFASTMPLAKMMGVTATEAAKDRVVGRLEVTADLCTINSAVHGGTLMTLADSIAAIGAFLNLPDGAAGTTTIESKTNFVGRAGIGDVLTAVATPVSIGRRMSVWQTRISTQAEALVAVVTQTQLVL